jgi:hypothetical protein
MRAAIELPQGPVDVYPVGVLADLLAIRVALDPRAPRPTGHQPRYVPPNDWRRKTITHRWRSIRRHWRRRSAWNGYLAEPYDSNSGTWTRCGHGWTVRRAVADLGRHLVDRQTAAH